MARSTVEAWSILALVDVDFTLSSRETFEGDLKLAKESSLISAIFNYLACIRNGTFQDRLSNCPHFDTDVIRIR